ncbi:hypothetical protein BV25DRAFT_1914508 [Artomyces pyxidatus]|uniref:Uncharacterized protein n=1 Tax=Artomyces pyxidatus TaxID=48021 RepID=A0ACB8T6B4_9AGAM|nr:hypothetical protein BV25DRAFT_1914508 [Artomyces pyxidatus]
MPSLAALYYGDLVCSAVFFGIYTVLTFTALYLLAQRKPTRTTILMAAMTVIMYGISTSYFVIEVTIVADSFLRVVDGHAVVRETFINLWGASVSAQITLQGINSTLGDAIVIWRAWAVWDRRLRVVIAPLVLLLGNFPRPEWSSHKLVLLCFLVTGSNASHIFLGIIAQLTGIYPTLIIVLVSLKLTQDQTVSGPRAAGNTGAATEIKFGTMTTGRRSVNVSLPTRSRSVSGTHSDDALPIGSDLEASSSSTDVDTDLMSLEAGGSEAWDTATA